MQLRDFLNNNSAIVTILAVVLLIVALGAIVMQLGGGAGGARVIDVYYYDLDTGEVFEAGSDVVPPIQSPSGNPTGGVRAYVFACNDCNNEADRFVGFLEMYRPEVKQALENPEEQPADQAYDYFEEGRLLRSIDAQEWYVASSAEAYQLQESIRDRCPGGDPKPCFPNF